VGESGRGGARLRAGLSSITPSLICTFLRPDCDFLLFFLSFFKIALHRDAIRRGTLFVSNSHMFSRGSIAIPETKRERDEEMRRDSQDKNDNDTFAGNLPILPICTCSICLSIFFFFMVSRKLGFIFVSLIFSIFLIHSGLRYRTFMTNFQMYLPGE